MSLCPEDEGPVLFADQQTLRIVSIASVFTPATLTVTLAEARNETLLRVSRVDFTSLNFANLPMQAGLSPGYTYTGPQYTVQRIVTATAAQGQILPISAPYVNSSWTLKFPGPALRCDAVEESAHNDIIANIAAVMKEAECFTSYGYVAWTPDTDGSLPFVKENNGTYSQRSGSIGPTLGDNPMSIFLAAFPRMFNEMPGETTVDCNNSQAYLVDATIIQCLLYNASYFANFTYSDGAQNVGISIADDYNDMLYLGGVGSFLATTSPDGVYIFGPDGQPVAYNVTPVETFAYQAVMDSFGMVLVGSIANEDINSIGEIVTTNTTVMSTVLSQTKELSFLENYSNAVGYSLENPSINTTWNGLSVNVSSSGSLPVAKSLEVLFQNATISLMSNALLQPNYSSPYAPPMAEVTTTPYQDIYVYSADVLWIAYGIAGAIALICVFIGIVTLLRARATYTNKFSTVLRTTRAAELSSQLQPVDMVGNDPLPGHIADATIKFARKQDLLTQGMEKVKMDTSSKISGVGRSQTA